MAEAPQDPELQDAGNGVPAVEVSGPDLANFADQLLSLIESKELTWPQVIVLRDFISEHDVVRTVVIKLGIVGREGGGKTEAFSLDAKEMGVFAVLAKLWGNSRNILFSYAAEGTAVQFKISTGVRDALVALVQIRSPDEQARSAVAEVIESVGPEEEVRPGYRALIVEDLVSLSDGELIRFERKLNSGRLRGLIISEEGEGRIYQQIFKCLEQLGYTFSFKRSRNLRQSELIQSPEGEEDICNLLLGCVEEAKERTGLAERIKARETKTAELAEPEPVSEEAVVPEPAEPVHLVGTAEPGAEVAVEEGIGVTEGIDVEVLGPRIMEVLEECARSDGITLDDSTHEQLTRLASQLAKRMTGLPSKERELFLGVVREQDIGGYEFLVERTRAVRGVGTLLYAIYGHLYGESFHALSFSAPFPVGESLPSIFWETEQARKLLTRILETTLEMVHGEGVVEEAVVPPVVELDEGVVSALADRIRDILERVVLSGGEVPLDLQEHASILAGQLVALPPDVLHELLRTVRVDSQYVYVFPPGLKKQASEIGRQLYDICGDLFGRDFFNFWEAPEESQEEGGRILWSSSKVQSLLIGILEATIKVVDEGRKVVPAREVEVTVVAEVAEFAPEVVKALADRIGQILSERISASGRRVSLDLQSQASTLAEKLGSLPPDTLRGFLERVQEFAAGSYVLPQQSEGISAEIGQQLKELCSALFGEGFLNLGAASAIHWSSRDVRGFLVDVLRATIKSLYGSESLELEGLDIQDLSGWINGEDKRSLREVLVLDNLRGGRIEQGMVLAHFRAVQGDIPSERIETFTHALFGLFDVQERPNLLFFGPSLFGLLLDMEDKRLVVEGPKEFSSHLRAIGIDTITDV